MTLLNIKSHFGPSNSNPRREDKGKGIAGESSRSIQQTQCFKCRECDHVSAQCLSKSRRLIIETQSDSDHDDLYETVHDP